MSRSAREGASLPEWFDPAAIGRRLQDLRGEQSQRELGHALGYLQPHISRYERGDVPGSYRFLAGLAALYDVDVNWLLTGEVVLPDAQRLPLAHTGVEEVRGTPATAIPTRVPRDGEQAAAGLMENLRQFVLDVVGAARESAPGRSRGRAISPSADRTSRDEVVRSLPTPVSDAWEAVLLELPLIVVSLLERQGEDTGRAARRPAPRDGGHDARRRGRPRATRGWRDLLAALRSRAERGRTSAVLRQLSDAAADVEERAASAVDLERARFLLLWSWVAAEAGSRSEPALARDAARLLFRLARATRKAGKLEEAERIYVEAGRRAAEAGAPEIAARCRAGIGNIHFERGEFEDARREYVALLEDALRLGHPALLYRAYLDLAAYYHEGVREFDKAAAYARTGLEIARREQDPQHVARFLNELGLNAMELGDMQTAKEHFEECLTIAEELGTPLLLAIGKINLGELRLRTRQHEEAAQLLREARGVASRAGLIWAECQADVLLARLDHEKGRTAEALERLDGVEDRCSAAGLRHERELARALEREIRQGMLGKLQALSA